MADRIIIALSGGVDSAVAALLLLQAGHAVEALHMTNWDEDEDGYCSAADDWQAAKSVADALQIPIHRVSFAPQYRANVFQNFLDEYAAGRTPNPDILCNREVKFGVCLEYATRLGGVALATGHYARLSTDASGTHLHRARDINKDQSYFLQRVPAAALARARFPLGDLLKSDVRKRAHDAGLPVYDRPDSTGICFIGERPFKAFLSGYLPATAGNIETLEGEVIGRHDGLMFHTLGQRQGLKIGGSNTGNGQAWYVAGKDMTRNVLRVVQGVDHPVLQVSRFRTEPIVWIGGLPFAQFECAVQIRHRQTAVAATVHWDPAGAQVLLSSPLRGVAPGQYAAFYQGDQCLGGAVIAAPGGAE
jgi:tRNA-specific 2-thiouridylase